MVSNKGSIGRKAGKMRLWIWCEVQDQGGGAPWPLLVNTSVVTLEGPKERVLEAEKGWRDEGYKEQVEAAAGEGQKQDDGGKSLIQHGLQCLRE